jgi:hypothetical protein
MNKTRRKEIDKLFKQLQAVQEKVQFLAEIETELDELATAIGDIQEAEQRDYDGLSERQQEGDKGGELAFAISELEETMDGIKTMIDAIAAFSNESFETTLRHLDEASGSPE